jgi:predicted polyphosphate/ATP-dependent NAD kinase
MDGATIGVIANPVSARDIRRVVTFAGNLQTGERVNIILRMLGAAHAAGVDRVLMMPDRGGIRALLERTLRRTTGSSHDPTFPTIEFLKMDPVSTVDDTFVATRLLVEAGVAAIAVLGGDGTHRAVVRELRRLGSHIPIAGLSTGTNNAFPEMREPTITGMAVGLYAGGRLADTDALTPGKVVEVEICDSAGVAAHDVAIVDAVVSAERYVGARAIWKADSIRQAFLAFADPECIGISAIGGLLQPVGRREAHGLRVDVASPHTTPRLNLHAPIAPGLVSAVPIEHWETMLPDHPHRVAAESGTIALDGERELSFGPTHRVTCTLRTGAFNVIDVARCMAVAATSGAVRYAPTA